MRQMPEMRAECMHCADTDCVAKMRMKLAVIILKTVSFPFQFQVRKESQHLSHFSQSGSHLTCES